MRYEFERDGTVVASVLWEGPGQVSVEAAEASTRAVVDRYLSSEVVYLGGGFDFGDEDDGGHPADAAPRLDPVGVRARLPQPEPPSAGARAPGGDRPGRGAGGGEAMKVTGADALLKALEREGVEVIFGIPGGASMPIYDPLVDRSPIRHVLCRHEQGAGHAAEGYAWATGQDRRVHGDLGPGRHEPRDADRRREDGLGADRGHHGAGAHAGRRQRRLPGGRHHRHHDADHEAQLPGEGPGVDRGDRARGVPHRRDRPSRARADRPAEGRPHRGDHVALARSRFAARLQAHDQGQPASGGGGREADHEARSARCCTWVAA